MTFVPPKEIMTPTAIEIMSNPVTTKAVAGTPSTSGLDSISESLLVVIPPSGSSNTLSKAAGALSAVGAGSISESLLVIILPTDSSVIIYPL
jgi:hypothetical protein